MKFIGKFEKPFYVISDCHWFHSRLAFDFGLRTQFKSIEEMNRIMWNNWNQTVSDDDIIFHLGDWVIGAENKYETAQTLYDSLNGRKFMMLGNHDYNLNKFTNINAYEEPVWLEYRGKTILLCHEPIYEFEQDYELCGHIHSHLESNKKLKANMFNCSVEMINFTPINIDEVLNVGCLLV